MKEWLLHIQFGTIAFGILSSCIFPMILGCDSHEPLDEFTDEDLLYLNFQPTVSCSVETRAAPVAVNSTGFPKSAKHNFGLWICDHDNSSFTPYIDWMQNIQSIYTPAVENLRDAWVFIYQGINHLRIGIEPKDEVDVYSYYPYIKNISDPTKIKFESGTYDLMRAKVQGVNSESIDTETNPLREVKVNLEYEHLLSCIQIDIVCERASSITLNNVVLHDELSPNADSEEKETNFLHKEGYMNIIDGSIMHDTSQRCDCIKLSGLGISLKKGVDNPQIYIMIPEVTGFIDNRFYLTFTFDGKESPAKFYLPRKLDLGGSETEIDCFKQGHVYLYRLHLDNLMRFEGVKVSNWNETPINVDIDI